MDGRDIGTAVLPDAQMKIYLTAGTAVRAKRRYEELKAQGIDKSLESIEKDIRNRDYRDMHRDISPLPGRRRRFGGYFGYGHRNGSEYDPPHL